MVIRGISPFPMPWSTCHTKGVTVTFKDEGRTCRQGGPVTVIVLRFGDRPL